MHNGAVTPFDSATTLEPTGDGTYRWQVPDGWQQGRGAWGGLAIGAMVRAVGQVEPDASRSVRSISLQMTSPAYVGIHMVSVRPARLGSRLSTWSVEVASESGEQVASAQVVTGTARPTSAGRDESAWSPLTAPSAPAASSVPASPTPPPFPTFTRHCEYRVITGAPLHGGPAETLGWISLTSPPTWSDAVVLALSDAWYSVALVSQQRRLWSPDGRLVVDSLQTIVVG